MPGKLIVLEGVDGCGKGSLTSMLVEDVAKDVALKNLSIVFTREPGGTIVGEAIRSVVYAENNLKRMAPGVVDLLFLASHVQNAKEIVEPSLKNGCIVISDRWWYSNAAYCAARETSPYASEVYEKMRAKHADLLIFLYGDVEVMWSRANARVDAADHQKKKPWNEIEKQAVVQQRYFDLYKHLPEFWPIDVTHKTVEEAYVEVRHAFDKTIGVA